MGFVVIVTVSLEDEGKTSKLNTFKTFCPTLKEAYLIKWGYEKLASNVLRFEVVIGLTIPTINGLVSIPITELPYIKEQIDRCFEEQNCK